MDNKKSQFIAKNISIPTPTEKDNKKDNIINWGLDNYYPYFLNFLYQNSAIQSGIINAKVHYTTSGGLNYVGDDKLEFEKFFNNGNSDYDLNEIAEQMSKDLELSNMFCLRGVWSLDKSRVEKLEVVDFEKIRYRLDDNYISVCNDWSDLKDNTIKILKPFDAGDREDREFYLIYQDKGKQTIDGRKVNKSIYPQPPYSGGLTSILTDVKINKYQLSEITNGFSTGTILNLNGGAPSNEKEKRALERDIQEHSTGEENAGGVLVLYNLGKENEASVVNLSGNDLKDRYIALSQDNRNNIILAHSITTPILFGIKTEGSLGNATELEIGYKIMKANYFKYKQRAILSALNEIAKKGNGLKGKIEFNEVELDFIPKVEEPIIFEKKKFESYNDYPESAVNNAKRCLEWVEKNGWGECGESTGKNRAHQIANREKLSRDTIARMASFKRHQQHKDVPYSEGCGGLMWDAWGGTSGINWAISKIKEIDGEKFNSEIDIVEMFNNCGSPKPKNIIYSRPLPNEFNPDEEEAKALELFKKETFAELNAIENQVLVMLADGNDYNTIQKSLDINGIKLTRIYNRLEALDLIADAEITTRGLGEIARQDVRKIKIYYAYEKNPAISGPSILPNNRTRQFCTDMVTLSTNKVWSRADIDTIGRAVGRDVFTYRGGFYNNGTKVTPWCRHVWSQKLVYI